MNLIRFRYVKICDLIRPFQSYMKFSGATGFVFAWPCGNIIGRHRLWFVIAFIQGVCIRDRRISDFTS